MEDDKIEILRATGLGNLLRYVFVFEDMQIFPSDIFYCTVSARKYIAANLFSFYIYASGRRFHPKRLIVRSLYTFFISMRVLWESVFAAYTLPSKAHLGCFLVYCAAIRDTTQLLQTQCYNSLPPHDTHIDAINGADCDVNS